MQFDTTMHLIGAILPGHIESSAGAELQSQNTGIGAKASQQFPTLHGQLTITSNKLSSCLKLKKGSFHERREEGKLSGVM